MTKKKYLENGMTEEEFLADLEKGKIVDTFEIVAPVEGTPHKVLVVAGDELIIMDSKKNGISIPLTEKYKNAKPGDIIYL